jgi:hypothetical protein
VAVAAHDDMIAASPDLSLRSTGSDPMIVTTTDGIDDRSIAAYLGIVTGEAVVGANIFRDMFASIRDVVGGRSGSY